MQTNQQTKVFAQELRKNATKEEKILWYQYLRKHPVQFRRQCVLGQYIVDFYCSKARLVVELDGSQHYDAAGLAYDACRTVYLESIGLKVLRFSNADVSQNLQGVCQQIDTELSQRYCDNPLPAGIGRKAFSTRNT